MASLFYFLTLVCLATSSLGVENSEGPNALSPRSLLYKLQRNSKSELDDLARQNVSEKVFEVKETGNRKCRFGVGRVECRTEDEFEKRGFKLDFGAAIRKLEEEKEVMETIQKQHSNELPHEK